MRYHSDKHFLQFLSTRWRQKSTGIDMQQNYVTVTHPVPQKPMYGVYLIGPSRYAKHNGASCCCRYSVVCACVSVGHTGAI